MHIKKRTDNPKPKLFDRFKKLDAFGEKPTLKLPKGQEVLHSSCGASFSLAIMVIIGLTLLNKLLVLSSNSIVSSVSSETRLTDYYRQNELYNITMDPRNPMSFQLAFTIVDGEGKAVQYEPQYASIQTYFKRDK